MNNVFLSNFSGYTIMLNNKYLQILIKKWRAISKKEPLKKIVDFVNEKKLWENLRKIQNSKFINSMYIWLFIVPITKKFLSKLKEPFKLYGYEFDLQSPFSWDMFFYSALFFVIANVIFFIFSPKIIQFYRDYDEYLISKRDREYLLNLIKKDSEEAYNYVIGCQGDGVNKKASDSELFYKGYDKLNELHKKARVACSLSYGIGFLLFLIVLGKNILWVISETLS